MPRKLRPLFWIGVDAVLGVAATLGVVVYLLLPGVRPQFAAAAAPLLALGIIAVACGAWIAFIRARRIANRLATDKTDALSAARRDHLTDLPNRLSMMELLEAALAPKSAQAILMFVDLDHFKEVNDALGHEAGDAVLRVAAKRLAAQLEPNDILARLGGDEFAAVLVHDANLARAERVAAAMIDAVQQPVEIGGQIVAVGASIGIAVREDGLAREELLRRADIAMYDAKAQTRRSYRVYSPDMTQELFAKHAIHMDLVTALRRGEMHLVYQPLVCAKDSAAHGAEALMRWRHPERGEVSPGQFIPIAEETGLILELGRWGLETAIAQAKEWGDTRIAVNVSPLQFRHHGFPALVGDLLLKYDLAPHLLEIEITEGVLVSHFDAAESTIRQLRALGVQVVLDDFGTGFSSLSYLQRFKFDALKIDRSFVHHLGERPESAQLARAIIDMAHSLNMRVVAEGVENARQAALLQLLGADILQGYHVGVPMSPSSFEQRRHRPVQDVAPLERGMFG